MNYLAHISLSPNDVFHQTGNLCCDRFKGKIWQGAKPAVYDGFKCHHLVDAFTDKHAKFKLVNAFLFEHYRHYSGVVLDVLIDHYLSRHWQRFHASTLTAFIDDFEENYSLKTHEFPDTVQSYVGGMLQAGVLRSYHNESGVILALERIQRRSKRNFNDKDLFALIAASHLDVEGLCLDVYHDVRKQIEEEAS